MDFLNFFRLKGITGTQEICIKIYMSLCSFKSIVPLCLVHLLKNNTRHVRAYSPDYLILYAIQDVQCNTEESPQGLERLVEVVILYSGLFNDRYAIEK